MSDRKKRSCLTNLHLSRQTYRFRDLIGVYLHSYYVMRVPNKSHGITCLVVHLTQISVYHNLRVHLGWLKWKCNRINRCFGVTCILVRNSYTNAYYIVVITVFFVVV